jgi:hypothetical protein
MAHAESCCRHVSQLLLLLLQQQCCSYLVMMWLAGNVMAGQPM